MKRAILALVVLALASTAMADYKVVGQIVYPEGIAGSTWSLYLMEYDTALSNPATKTFVAGGYGLCGFAIDLYGATPGTFDGATPMGSYGDGEFANLVQVKNGTLSQGFLGWGQTLADGTVDATGKVQPSAGQQLGVTTVYYFGVKDTSYYHSGWKVNNVLNATQYYAGPADPGSGVAGVLVWSGFKPADGLITWNETDANKRQANVLSAASGTSNSAVEITMLANVPEPATLALLALGGLAALRRRRA